MNAYTWDLKTIGSMTLVEARAIIKTWAKNPPSNVLLKWIVEGLMGKPSGQPRQQIGADGLPVPQSGLEHGVNTDAQLIEIAAKSGGSVPVQRGRDLGLPPTPPVWDMDELRERNRNIVVQRALEKYGASAHG